MPQTIPLPLPKPKDWQPSIAELRAYAAKCLALAEHLEGGAPKNGKTR